MTPPGILPEPQRIPIDITIAPVVQPQLQPPPLPCGKADTFVDDVVLVFLDTPEKIVPVRQQQYHSPSI
jgi:hypothetical protein